MHVSFFFVVTCPALSAPPNGMIEYLSAPSPEPTPAPEPTPLVKKRFLLPYFNYDHYLVDGSSIGDICTFTCDEDYVISGSDDRTCENDGTWSGTSTTCESKFSCY